MRPHELSALLLAALLAAAGTSIEAQPPATSSVLGTWRVVRGVPLSNDAGPPAPPRAMTVGSAIRFEPTRVAGPGVLACDQAAYAPTSMDAEGLFQGTLSAPAKASAARLGVVTFPVPGVSLTCSTGLFELHRVDANTLLVALDNVVWTLDRSAGALASADTPAGTVQHLLESHMAGDMGFDTASIARKRRWLTGSFATRIHGYLARPISADEVPDINGDPFTDSQEYPTRFSVRVGSRANDVAVVPVRFTDGYAARLVSYVLRREDGAWRVDDIRYERGPTFRALTR